MITVLHLLNTGKFSGAEHVVIDIIKLNSEKRMIYASFDGSIRERLETENIEFFALKDSTAGSVKEAVKKYRPDIIHAHDFTMTYNAARVCGKIPIVSQIHNNPPWIKKFYDPRSIAFALAQVKVKKMVVVSEAIINEYIYGFLIRQKATVIGNIIDADNVLAQAKLKPQKSTRFDVSIHEDGVYDIAFLGRFSPQKNPLYFCSIIKQLKVKKSDVRVVMIGTGEMMPEVEQFIEENGLFGNITILGFQDNPYCWLKQAKILLMPSRWEGFGLAAVEGMVLGKPVVCSGAGGLSGIVDETCGKIAKSDGEYVSEILKLLNDFDYYKRKSEAAIQRAKIFCDKEQYIKKISDVYKSVLDK